MATLNERIAQSVTFQGMNVVYDSYGADNEEEVLVFIHGWCCSRKLWTAQSPLYKRHRSILIDLPGHGDSDAPEIEYSLELFARAVKAVIEREQVSKVVLVAHSMGGPVATMFVRLFDPAVTLSAPLPLSSVQDRVTVAGIVYVDSFLYLPESYLTIQQRQSLRESLQDDQEFLAIIDAISVPKLYEKVHKTATQTMLATPKHVRTTATMTVSHVMPYEEVYDQIPAINIIMTPQRRPVHGSWSHHFPLLKLKEMAGVSHWLFMEKPDEFNREVEDFLAEHRLLQRTSPSV